MPESKLEPEPELSEMEQALMDEETRAAALSQKRQDGGLESLDLSTQVVFFYKDGSLRRAYELFWVPWQSDDWQKLKNHITGKPNGIIQPSYMDESWGLPSKCEAPQRPPSTIIRKVRIMLDYPLNRQWTRVVDVDLRRIGQIFGHAHDLYRDLYDADDAAGGGARVCDMDPKSNLTNRAKGHMVWGHDMSDLVFEQVYLKYLEDDEDGCVLNVSFGIGS